jgi:hypothetical protein
MFTYTHYTSSFWIKSSSSSHTKLSRFLYHFISINREKSRPGLSRIWSIFSNNGSLNLSFGQKWNFCRNFGLGQNSVSAKHWNLSFRPKIEFLFRSFTSGLFAIRWPFFSSDVLLFNRNAQTYTRRLCHGFPKASRCENTFASTISETQILCPRMFPLRQGFRKE